MDFFTLTKVRKGVYEGFTPKHTHYLVLSYPHGSKVNWAICAPLARIPEDDSSPPSVAALDAVADVIPRGWAIASTGHRARYQARIWAEANLT